MRRCLGISLLPLLLPLPLGPGGRHRPLLLLLLPPCVGVGVYNIVCKRPALW